jgi:hypothetical protein
MAWIWDSKADIATLLLGEGPRDRGSIPDRGVRQITHSHLLPRCRARGTLPPLPYILSWLAH